MVEEQHKLDLIPAYALGCLDKAELVDIEEHLAVCESCRQELKAYQKLADQLPFALAQTTPPPTVKDKLMERLAARKADRKDSAAEKPASWWERLSASLQSRAPAWALASLVIVLLLVSSNLYLWRQVSQLKPGELPMIALQSSGVAPRAAGTIVVSRDGARGALVVDGLKSLGASQQYQLWLIKGGLRTNGGVFSVDEGGYATFYVESPKPLSSYDSIGVTIEPAGGSPAPTGDKVLGGKL
jgi:anti-sigma-K factor RskA